MIVPNYLSVLLVAQMSAGRVKAEQVGLAYSGGGISGLLQTMCSQDWLYSNVPGFARAELSVSTASGGTIGYLLHQSLGSDGLSYPVPLSPNLTHDELSKRKRSPGHKYWAEVVRWLRHFVPPDIMDSVNRSAAPTPNAQDGWWEKALRSGLFRLFYGVDSKDVGGALGLGNHIINLAVLEREGCPINRTEANGWMQNADQYLRIATLEHTPGNNTLEMRIAGGIRIDAKTGKNWKPLDGAAYSSYFFTQALGIVENPLLYANERVLEELGKGVLISAKSTKGKWLYLSDGGLADTTGIVAHLQREHRRIFAVYVNNNCLKSYEEDPRCEKASIAYLFGQKTSTNGQNTLGGPALSQVFDSKLYNEVIANLTNPALLLARLTNVQVMQNSYFEVRPYIVEELIILSNGRSDGFLDYFQDPAVKSAVDPLWPDRIPVTPDIFNANLMCEHQRYKLQKNADVVKAFFSKADSLSEHILV